MRCLKTNYGRHFVTLLILLIPLFSGLYWICLIMIAFLGFYWLFNYLGKLIKHPTLKKLLKMSILFFGFFVISVLIKLFWFEIYKVPSSSMEDTLFPKDIIFINKLPYGPKLPRSPLDIPWLNLVFYKNRRWRDSLSSHSWNDKRLSGFTNVKKGDIVLFTMPFDNSFHIVKRCMAVSGDTLTIRDGSTYVNNEFYLPTPLVKTEYVIEGLLTKSSLTKKLDSLGIDTTLTKRDTDFIATLSLKSLVETKKIGLMPSKVIDSLATRSLYPEAPEINWSLDNYGPLIIPKKGMKILLNMDNYLKYKSVISQFEGTEITRLGDSYLVGNLKKESYTFRRSYFFMMGDNRKQSSDSRFFGFVPSERIIGKVQYVICSTHNDQFRWDRFLRPVF